MSGNPEVVYRTTSPDAIAWAENIQRLRTEEIKLRTAFEEEMLALYGPSQRDTYERNEDGSKKENDRRALWIRGDRVYALDSGYNEQPPADSGWRLDSKEHDWRPKLATKAGKELRDRLNGLNLLHLRDQWEKIGIPPVVFTGNYMFSPGYEFDAKEGVVYISWGTQWVEEDWKKSTAKFPDIVWEKVPLSEWHARQEAKKSGS